MLQPQDFPRFRQALKDAMDVLAFRADMGGYENEPEFQKVMAYLQNVRNSLPDQSKEER